MSRQMAAATLQAIQQVAAVAKQTADRVEETLASTFSDNGFRTLASGLGKIEKDEVKRILVWNFKAGQTSAFLLKEFPLAQVIATTNDKDFHIEAAKKHIDKTWPWRHVLRLGDNKEILSQFREFDPHPFDLVVVDSQSNEVETIKAVAGSLPLTRPDTPVLILNAVGGKGKVLEGTRPATNAWKRLVSFGALRTEKATTFTSQNGEDTFVLLRT